MPRSNSIIHFSSPYVFISGSYERSRNNDNLCKALAYELAKYHIGVISAGERPGLQVTKHIDKILSNLDEYEPTKFLTFYRKKVKEEEELGVGRIGCKVFIGRTISEMRNAAFVKTRVVIVIGGGKRIIEEIALAEEQEIPVIPIGMSGGTASTCWEQYFTARKSANEGTFVQLNNKNALIAGRDSRHIKVDVFFKRLASL